MKHFKTHFSFTLTKVLNTKNGFCNEAKSKECVKRQNINKISFQKVEIQKLLCIKHTIVDKIKKAELIKRQIKNSF